MTHAIKDDITKKTLYHFKKFARERGFFNIYKQHSNSLKYYTFIEVLNQYEPVELIQSVQVFCSWITVAYERQDWSKLSQDWAKICEEKKLYRNYAFFKNYYRVYII